MLGNSLAFWTGIFWLQHATDLPNGLTLAFLLFLSLCCAWHKAWPVSSLCLGLIWASLFSQIRLGNQLPTEHIQQKISIEGYISSLPQQHPHHQSFDFVVRTPENHFPQKLRLNWYDAPPLAAGQSWTLSVKLKPPHGTLNPASFDYEAWLFANGFDATGYVTTGDPAKSEQTLFSIQQWLCRWRQDLSDRIDHALPASPQTPIIKALTIGSQNGISQTQWQLYQQTGLIHLIVISGSHITLIAGLAFSITRKIWLASGWMRIPALWPAALASWLTGLLYGSIAGLTIPTLRAVLMLSIILLAKLWQRHSSPWRLFSAAVTGVLLIEPTAVLQSGFWLSFLAVALLIHLHDGRLGKPDTWQEWVFAHCASSLALSPLLLLFFQQLSLIAPVANAIAIPLLGLFVIPLALISVLLLYITPDLASYLLQVCDFLLSQLETSMSWLANFAWSSLNLSQPPFYAVLYAGLGIYLLTAVRGFPGRHMAVFMFTPLVFLHVQRPNFAEVTLTLLDVGQGLATLISTQHHHLVFDTGSRSPDGLDMGAAVVLPAIYQQGIKSLDTLIISHGDNDHSGGGQSLSEQLKIDRILSSDPTWAERPTAEYCQTGQQWHWDGVEFRILAPPATGFIKENNNSCVLQITTTGQHLLLTGDIEAEAEQWLVEQFGSALASTVLIVPHHGSKTSSTQAFLDQVQPTLSLVSSGYLNRFHFPHPTVSQRYHAIGSRYLNTADSGAIYIHTQDKDLSVTTERQKHRHYWRRSAAH